MANGARGGSVQSIDAPGSVAVHPAVGATV
jgi:hypothetical protein